MELTLICISCFLILVSILPFIQHQHWIFRVPEFLKVQILILQIIVFLLSFLILKNFYLLIILQILQLILIGYHVFILMRYTKFWRSKKVANCKNSSATVKVISCNVFQFNTEYDQLITLIKKEEPDIFLTMESNGDWEKAMRVFEKDYPNFQKVTLENTYGMHFYTKLKINKVETHFFVAEDLPSIEAELVTKDGSKFVFFGVHPPPPSPTEEATSKERDGDLLSVAKKVRNHKLPVLVAGDFNTVAWSKASLLFKKTSGLIDARIGRGLLSTFHANYWFFRIPLDLVFHSPSIFISKLSIYPSINSDHFPVGVEFQIDEHNDAQEEDVKDLEAEEMAKVNELIQEGKEEQSDNRTEEATE